MHVGGKGLEMCSLHRAGFLLFALALSTKAADGEGGCENFAWHLTGEWTWFALSGNPSIAVAAQVDDRKKYHAEIDGGLGGARNATDEGKGECTARARWWVGTNFGGGARCQHSPAFSYR
jgi:hypothetical protein